MGEQNVNPDLSGDELRRFIEILLADLRALSRMIDSGMIESGRRRVGAEQEMFIVDEGFRPAPTAMELLEAVDDPHFTTELARFNLELNLDPLLFADDCLSRMEEQLNTLLAKLRDVAAQQGSEIVLCGILPSLRKSDLSLQNMTPNARYFALNRAMNRLRGGAYDFHIRGVDEISVQHDSVMLESCNTSFQIHFQVGADEFARLYNLAQAIAAPVLALCTNSPLLFGRRLWRETRIALFQQSVDTRSSSHHLRERRPRVSFGSKWVSESVTELFKDDIARFKILLGGELDENPIEKLDRGEIPSLKALRLHNGTVYRWNRPCYGITDGRPHLRIENRFIPAGPTVVDEIANAALWFGLMSALGNDIEDVRLRMDFEHAQANFTAAARSGLSAELVWLDGRVVSVCDLLRDELLPAARLGLENKGIRSDDIERYMSVLERRLSTKQTGSAWILDSLAALRGTATEGERMSAITAASVRLERQGQPVSEWALAEIEESGGWKHHFVRVEQFMSTDLYTVHEDEPIDLVASLMQWEKIRHVPVEDEHHNLVGLVSYRSVLKLVAEREYGQENRLIPVSEIMKRDLVTVEPETHSLDAIALMRKHRIGSLPVVTDGRLVGMISERDFMNIARGLLQEKLQAPE